MAEFDTFQIILPALPAVVCGADEFVRSQALSAVSKRFILFYSSPAIQARSMHPLRAASATARCDEVFSLSIVKADSALKLGLIINVHSYRFAVR